MEKVSIAQLKEAKRKLKAAGYQLKGWARAHGHNDTTFDSLLRGGEAYKHQGPVVQKIIADLISEGWVAIKEKNRRAA